MKERPILFSVPMVRAILEGRKTQTRRIIKPNPDGWVRGSNGYFGVPYKKTTKNPSKNGCVWVEDDGPKYEPIKCPYGYPDGILWVRETWVLADFDFDHITNGYLYRADFEGPVDWNWKPSIFMPRAASRISLLVEDVWAEPLQDISEDDAIAEGVDSFRPVPGDGPPETMFKNYITGKYSLRTAVESYKSLWESINGPESWGENPFVWVIKFKRI